MDALGWIAAIGMILMFLGIGFILFLDSRHSKTANTGSRKGEHGHGGIVPSDMQRDMMDRG